MLLLLLLLLVTGQHQFPKEHNLAFPIQLKASPKELDSLLFEKKWKIIPLLMVELTEYYWLLLLKKVKAPYKHKYCLFCVFLFRSNAKRMCPMDMSTNSGLQEYGIDSSKLQANILDNVNKQTYELKELATYARSSQITYSQVYWNNLWLFLFSH